SYFGHRSRERRQLSATDDAVDTLGRDHRDDKARRVDGQLIEGSRQKVSLLEVRRDQRVKGERVSRRRAAQRRRGRRALQSLRRRRPARPSRSIVNDNSHAHAFTSTPDELLATCVSTSSNIPTACSISAADTLNGGSISN